MIASWMSLSRDGSEERKDVDRTAGSVGSWEMTSERSWARCDKRASVVGPREVVENDRERVTGGGEGVSTGESNSDADDIESLRRAVCSFETARRGCEGRREEGIGG